MRPNDLIWNYVVSNYLHGETPPAFDILYWNNDTTRLPAQLHCDFLDIFKDIRFRRAGRAAHTQRADRPDKVTCPIFITGGMTDHITPWSAVIARPSSFGGETTFVLSTAGHIQSLINPPGSRNGDTSGTRTRRLRRDLAGARNRTRRLLVALLDRLAQGALCGEYERRCAGQCAIFPAMRCAGYVRARMS